MRGKKPQALNEGLPSGVGADLVATMNPLPMGCRMEMENPLKALQRKPCGGFGMDSRIAKAEQWTERPQPHKKSRLFITCSLHLFADA